MSTNVVSGAAAEREYAKWICPTKRGFKRLSQAKTAAVASLASDATLKALYSYRCQACGQHHLTKKKHGRPLAARPKGTEGEIA